MITQHDDIDEKNRQKRTWWTLLMSLRDQITEQIRQERRSRTFIIIIIIFYYSNEKLLKDLPDLNHLF